MAAQAVRTPARVWTTLAHLIAVDGLREASRPTSQARAPGSAGVTAPPSAAHLDEHRHDVQERLRSGRSPARPVARVWIAQEDGQQRPIGHPTCEDQIVHRAVALLRDAIDEPDCADSA
jgi:retron-type reverse transcriptase